MPRIVVDSEDLASRGREFSKLLKPIFKSTSSVIATKNFSIGNGRYAIAAFDHLEPPTFTDSRFFTFADEIYAQYYEIWIPIDQKKMDSWYLFHAYLNLFYRETEFLCLHSDPEEPDQDRGTKACYKRSPHIHLKSNANLFSKSHFATCHGFLDRIFYSKEDFFKAYHNSIELLCDEVLSKID
jgi:hypothetical protein